MKILTTMVLLLLPLITAAQKMSISEKMIEKTTGTNQIINDDLIVQSSVGIGENIINGYVFGYNTFVSQNKDIKWLFDDTSENDFPATDWGFETNFINQSYAYFEIKNITQNSTPLSINTTALDNTMVIKETTGFVGIGTDSPLVNLHLVEDQTPIIRLKQTDYGGWPFYEWEIRADAWGFVIRDKSSLKSPFVIRQNAPENTLVISDDGNIGIGTDQPSSKLEVNGSMMIRDSLILGSTTIKASADTSLSFKMNYHYMKLKKK